MQIFRKKIRYTFNTDPSLEKALADVEIPQAENAENFLKKLALSASLTKAEQIFENSPTSSLLGAKSRALMFFLIRYLKPKYALEIGTYKAGTAEVIAKALSMNQSGLLYTIDPFGKIRAPFILEQWPKSLKKYVQFMGVSSMDCFMQFQDKTVLDFVFIDGDHSYEYALYDLQMAARNAAPGAIIVMDNVEQTGVYWAGKTFLSGAPNWRELGKSIAEHDVQNPYETMKPSFPHSSFLILQGPTKILVSDMPRSFATAHAQEKGLAGYDLAFAGCQCSGRLNIMTVFRSFFHKGYAGEPEQMIQISSLPIQQGEKALHLEFKTPFQTTHTPEHSYRSYEIILSWQADSKPASFLELASEPQPIKM